MRIDLITAIPKIFGIPHNFQGFQRERIGNCQKVFGRAFGAQGQISSQIVLLKLCIWELTPPVCLDRNALICDVLEVIGVTAYEKWVSHRGGIPRKWLMRLKIFFRQRKVITKSRLPKVWPTGCEPARLACTVGSVVQLSTTSAAYSTENLCYLFDNHINVYCS